MLKIHQPSQQKRGQKRGPAAWLIRPILDEAGLALLKIAISDMNLNARTCDRILKVARTIAIEAAMGNEVTERGKTGRRPALNAQHIQVLRAITGEQPRSSLDR